MYVRSTRTCSACTECSVELRIRHVRTRTCICAFDAGLVRTERFFLAVAEDPACEGLTDDANGYAEHWRTYGGNDPGAKCHIPFVVDQKCHRECLSMSGNKYWCATEKYYIYGANFTYCRERKIVLTSTNPSLVHVHVHVHSIQ